MTLFPRQKYYTSLVACAGLLAIAGCSPLVSLAGAALSGTSGGSTGSASSGVQGIGAPSLVQNANTRSPVQNHESADQAIHEVLDHAENQTTRESCLKGLPPEAKSPVTECMIRLTCIPGVSRALMMRTCPAETTGTQAGGQMMDAPVRAEYAGPAWRWSNTSGP